MKPRFALLSLVLALLLLPSVDTAQQPKVPPAQPAPPARPAGEEARVTETPHEMTAPDVAAFLDGFVPMQLERENIAGAVVLVMVNSIELIKNQMNA